MQGSVFSKFACRAFPSAPASDQEPDQPGRASSGGAVTPEDQQQEDSPILAQPRDCTAAAGFAMLAMSNHSKSSAVMPVLKELLGHKRLKLTLRKQLLRILALHPCPEVSCASYSLTEAGLRCQALSYCPLSATPFQALQPLLIPCILLSLACHDI